MLGTFWVLIEWGDNSSPIRYPNPLPFPLKSQAVLQLCKEDGRLLGSSVVKNPPAKQDMWVPSRVGEIPWRREWLPTPVILPGESRGQKGLEGYSPWGHKRVVLNSATKQQQTAKKDGKLWMSFKQESTSLKLAVWLSITRTFSSTFPKHKLSSPLVHPVAEWSVEEWSVRSTGDWGVWAHS